MRNETDKLALVWAIPFVLCSITLCLAYVFGESTVAAAQMLYLVACLGLAGTLVFFLNTLYRRRRTSVDDDISNDERPAEAAQVRCIRETPEGQ